MGHTCSCQEDQSEDFDRSQFGNSLKWVVMLAVSFLAFLIFAYFDLFEEILEISRKYEFVQVDELIVALAGLALAVLLLYIPFQFVRSRSILGPAQEASRRDFIETLAKYKADKANDAAVFIIETDGSLDEETLEQAKHQLEGLVGESSLTVFRVR